MTVEEPRNIRAFNWLTLKVLNELYDSFPEPKDFDGLRFVISTLFDVNPKSEEAQYLSYFSATVRWLHAEGFLRYRNEDSGNFFGVVLSMRGLTALGFEPKSLKPFGPKEPLIVKIKRTLSKNAKEISSDVLRQLVIKLLMGGISGGGASGG